MVTVETQCGYDLCKQHSKRMDYYCVNCDVPLCANCFMDKNSPHKLHELEERAVHFKNCDINSTLDFAKMIENHQSISAKICFNELVKLKSSTQRSILVWLAFAERIQQYVQLFIRNRIGDFARAKAQHFLVQGAAACDAASNNSRLIHYLTKIKDLDATNIDGVTAHNVYRKLKNTEKEPAVLCGYDDLNDSPLGIDNEQFDDAIKEVKDICEKLASKLNLSSEATTPGALTEMVTLKPFHEAPVSWVDANKSYPTDSLAHELESPPEVVDDKSHISVPPFMVPTRKHTKSNTVSEASSKGIFFLTFN